MLFHFLNFSQCVECMFGHNTSYKVTNLKVHSKGRYFVFKESLFKNYNEWLVWTTKLFSCICDITNCKSRLWKFEWLGGVGENAWLSTAHFKIKTRCGCFYITVFLMETNCFQKILDVIFISSYIMSDKASFVRGALFCVQRYRGNLDLSHSNSASRWQRINLPSKTLSKLFANHNALGQLTNHNTFCFSEGRPSSNPELIKSSFVSGWGERYCNNVTYVKIMRFSNHQAWIKTF